MSDLHHDQPPPPEERRAELRVPASTLGDVRTRLIGGTDFSLLNYTPHSLYGESRSRLIVGARISVRLATATLDAIVTGRVVRSSLTHMKGGVPHYEVAVTLEQPVDWARDTAAPEREPEFESSTDDGSALEVVGVLAPDPASAE